ncbi:selenocysteine-specific translation elongation factor [Chloracidobacterium aggregatum]|uniref:Selenocysteine-specific elongation factor n=1 Tax=Chloracidobacterium sp. N TaxID=2821540 RepID=A0ABX8B526_9BACT|nr:selenocysteine-specific translation elongation factor [Chloracidobacterium aggregatum]QUV88545.1 selenocysteine-specific translation elongation factor [Chloracidobacterium sp. S]QUV91466.1 selenocysteine-specific translation elongation factor [Chloracidobacterium sp. A]QUV94641.1 selenocysteine-specific translation elongation factor [Chloracidobacterium sp. N]QUV97845.1 selenocysteine-specific translation elongation factor [Chloracidobacterium sp. E]
MERSVIIGTAGHIDHGKTSLVQALTGTNPDRLPEEQRRGMTIDLGFAHLNYRDWRFAFVDVPGHERFIKNMLAGAHGIDLVLLVIAADEGVMPQTVEHLAICQLLGLSHGVIALTKCDLVEPDWLALIRDDVTRFTQGTFLAGKPVVAVSARTGAGCEALLQALAGEAATVRPHAVARPPRLPIDRIFTRPGFGTVVTGTLISGTFAVGEEVSIEPGGLVTRIRGLEVHGVARKEVRAGERVALNLASLEVGDLRRGDVVTPLHRFHPTSRLDVQLELLATAPSPLTDDARVRLHHGTSEVMARVTLLDGRRELPPGNVGFAQLRLEAPLLALPDDRFILRRYSPATTIGGGKVLDAHPPRRRGRWRQTDELLKQLAAGGDQRRMAFVRRTGATGLTLAELASLTGDSDAELEAFARRTPECVFLGPARRLVAQTALDQLCQNITMTLEMLHRERPRQPDLPREEIRQRTAHDLPAEVFQQAVAQLVREQRVFADARTMRLASHQIQLSAADTALKQTVEQLCRQAGWHMPTLPDLCRLTSRPEGHVLADVQLLLTEGRLVRVGDFLLHAEAASELLARLRQAKTKGETLDVGAFKVLFDLPRKYAIPLLEWLDQTGVTRRYGNTRLMA